MSTIHSSWVPLGLRASVRRGTARLRTVRSITVIMQGRARTARPSQARRGRVGVLIQRRRMGVRQFDMLNQATGTPKKSDLAPARGGILERMFYDWGSGRRFGCRRGVEDIAERRDGFEGHP